jgi:hypothetical protein
MFGTLQILHTNSGLANAFCNGWWAICGLHIRKIGPKAREPPDPTPQDTFLA